ncbi:hypothetical protein [Lacinutrix sp. Bg11-31]|uniref:hypothetical protein n=1 Tax=Lacinutrix sp. Bg11-31 TaxID=2057808 RepID=UPI000C31404A|nr:hypothetical protein [Lacinutrix sp. Bg11-31]AUC81673.1 hypothetical protein CW733_05825 [Lacinutrix sp. Bg11-31]
MKYKNTISYWLILIGGSIAIYANANEKQSILLLVLGIFTLMSGLFMLNASLSSKTPKSDYEINDEEE